MGPIYRWGARQDYLLRLFFSLGWIDDGTRLPWHEVDSGA